MTLSTIHALVLQVCFLLMVSSIYGQGNTCASAEPFCTGTGEVFTNSTGAGNAQTGPDYGCLFSTPNPSWFFMQVGSSGNINLTIAQTSNGGAGLDVDFICWGPFSTLTGVCNQLTSGNIEDCSFSIASVETCSITNATAGDFYVVLITNYSNSAGSIDFQQTSGAGQADCDLLNPCNADAGVDQEICSGGSVQIGGAPSATGGDDSFIYSWSPITGLDDPSSPNPIADPIASTTYTLTIDDEAGCTMTDEVTVIIASTPTVTVPPMYEICAGESATVTFDFTGVAPFEFEYTLNGIAQGLITPFFNSYVLSVSENATIEVISLSDQNCSSNASVSTQVQLQDIPSAIIGGEGSYCEGEMIALPIILSGNGPFEINYTIDGLPQSPVISSNSTYTILTDQAGTYEITSISDSNCSAGIQNSSQVDFFPPIDITLTYDDEICASDPVLVTATASGGQSGSYEFLWTDANSTLYTGNPVQVSSTSDILLNLVVSGGCNIPYTASAFIDVHALPIVDTGPSTTLDCLDSTPILDGSASDSGSFLWTTTDGNILSIPTFEVITVNSPGTYQLEVTSTDGCTGVSSVDVASGLIQASATLIGPEVLCGSETGDFSLIFDQAGVWNFFLSIDGVEGPSGWVVGDQLDFTSDQTGVYEIISATYGVCEAEVLNTLEVSLEETPTVTFPSGDLNLCEGESSLVEVVVTGDGVLTFEYTIDGQSPESISSNAGTFDLDFGTTGYVIPLSISSANCVGFVSGGFDLNVAPLPSASLTTSDYTICEGESAEVLVTLEGIPPFEFGYSIDGTAQDFLTSLNNAFTLLIATEGTIELISISDANCDGTVSGISDVAVNPLPTASISGGLTVCTGEVVTLPISLEGTGPFEIGYSIDGSTLSTISTSSLSYDLDALLPGTYTLTSINDAFCGDGVQNSTTVSYFSSIAIDLDYDSAICENDTVYVAASASGGMDDGYTFLWSDSFSNTFEGSALTFVLDEPLELGLSVNDGCNLPSTANLSIDVQAYPEPSFFALEDSICIGESVNLIKDSEDSAVQCVWTFDSGETLTGCEGVSYSFLSPGYQSLILTATTSAGCIGTLMEDSVLFVLPDPLAEFRIIPLDGTIFNPDIKFENLSEHSVEYLWEFGDGLEETELSPLHSYPGAVSDYYTACLSAYNALGCVDTVCHFLEIVPEFLMSIPNAFTPDDDGVNDFFLPVFNDIILAEYDLAIFNRLGEIVFHSSDQYESWNGVGDEGSNFYGMDAVYFYRIVTREENRSEKREFIGEVILIR